MDTNLGIGRIETMTFDEDLTGLGICHNSQSLPEITDPSDPSKVLTFLHRELLVRFCSLPQEQQIRILKVVKQVMDLRNTNFFLRKIRWSRVSNRKVVFQRDRSVNTIFISLE